MRLGIFGGTFDPPHVAHLILAQEAAYNLTLDQVLWVITSDPPHKRGQPITELRHRLDMVNAALAAEPMFSLSRIEIDRPGPQYVVDTMRLLRERYPNAELFYLMGGDSLHDLPAWNRPREFVAFCDGLGIMRRPNDEIDLDDLESLYPGILKKIHFIDAPYMEVSSQDIRSRVSERKPFRYFLPAAVYQIIQERGLYR
jgi:nicotinate-nucleotide adenylyltransferase